MFYFYLGQDVCEMASSAKVYSYQSAGYKRDKENLRADDTVSDQIHPI